MNLTQYKFKITEFQYKYRTTDKKLRKKNYLT